MITPILERLILTGRAKKYNKVHGVSAAGKIICPKDRWIVITDILFTPFVDDPDNPLMCIDYQVNLRSKGNFQNYIFRVNVLEGLNLQNPILRDVFDIFDSDAIITISKVLDISAVAAPGDVDFNSLPPAAGQQPAPNGYGTTIPVTRGWSQDSTVPAATIFPAGIGKAELQGSAIASNGRQSDDYKTDVVLGSNDLLQPETNANFPLINFTFVSVNSKDLEGL